VRWLRQKEIRAKPRDIAQKVADRLKANPLFAKIEIAGPGFINLDVTDAALAERAGVMARGRNELGAPENRAPARRWSSISADRMWPNHAMWGHCARRSSEIACSACSAPTAGACPAMCILGDWGLQMGQLISEIGLRGLAPGLFRSGFQRSVPG